MKAATNLYKSASYLVGLSRLELLTPTMSILCATARILLKTKEIHRFFRAKKLEILQFLTFLNQRLTKTALLYIAVISPFLFLRNSF